MTTPQHVPLHIVHEGLRHHSNMSNDLPHEFPPLALSEAQKASLRALLSYHLLVGHSSAQGILGVLHIW